MKIKVRHVLFLVSLLTAIQFVNAQQMRAIYSLWPYQSGNSNWATSDASYELYSKLGYNTFLECIPYPEKEQWDTSRFVLNSTTRNNLIQYIREQKTRVEAAGMKYCPFSGQWGWANDLYALSERARAMVYREVDVFSGPYYGLNIMSSLQKDTTSGWGPVTTTWSSTLDTVRLGYTDNANGCARIFIHTNDYSTNPIGTLPNHLINGQCYDISYELDLSNADLQIGNKIVIYYFRQFAQGQKPDPSMVPLGELMSPTSEYKELIVKEYIVDSIMPNRYVLNKNITIGSGTNYRRVLNDTLWMEKVLHCGLGNYAFNDSIRLDIEVNRTGTGNHSVALNNIEITPVKPDDIVVNRGWELSQFYSYFTARHSDELKRETKADFLVNGSTVRSRLFLDPTPTNGVLTKVLGHFYPYTHDFGARLSQKPGDPISPVAIEATMEMLRIIKAGLGNTEPSYYFLASDEVPVLRRDYLNMRNGAASTTYNNSTNLEYYAKVLRLQMNEYKKVFKGDTNATVVTTFIAYADVATPSGMGYHHFAERQNDDDAIAYLESTRGTDKISFAIWEYDYCGVPKCQQCQPKVFSVKDQAFMEESIDMLNNHGIDYTAVYATDGAQNDLAKTDPSIDTDPEHIQHEIDYARDWASITSTNSSNFTGYMYCGWEPYFKANRWNGLYSQAYFSWAKPGATDFPPSWKTYSATNRGDNNQPVLEMLDSSIVPDDFYSSSNIKVYSRHEGLNENNTSKPRIHVKNNGTSSLSQFTVHFYFTVENKKTPVLDRYYTQGSTATLVNRGNSLYEIQFYFAGSLAPGANTDNVVGLHYNDWSSWNRVNDYSCNNSINLTENNRIVVTDNNSSVIYGIAP